MVVGQIKAIVKLSKLFRLQFNLTERIYHGKSKVESTGRTDSVVGLQ